MKNHKKPVDYRKKAAFTGYAAGTAVVQNNENPASFFGNFQQPQKSAPQPIPKPVTQSFEPVRQQQQAPPKQADNLLDLLDQPDPQPQIQPQ